MIEALGREWLSWPWSSLVWGRIRRTGQSILDGIKALKGAESKRRFFGRGSPKYKAKGHRNKWGVSKPNLQKPVFKRLGPPKQSNYRKSPTKFQNWQKINFFAYLDSFSLLAQVRESSEYLRDFCRPQPASPSTNLCAGWKDSSSHSRMGEGYIRL